MCWVISAAADVTALLLFSPQKDHDELIFSHIFHFPLDGVGVSSRPEEQQKQARGFIICLAASFPLYYGVARILRSHNKGTSEDVAPTPSFELFIAPIARV